MSSSNLQKKKYLPTLPNVFSAVTRTTQLFFGGPSLVLVQPRKTCPCLTEILLMGGKESNLTNFQLAKLMRMDEME